MFTRLLGSIPATCLTGHQTQTRRVGRSVISNPSSFASGRASVKTLDDVAEAIPEANQYCLDSIEAGDPEILMAEYLQNEANSQCFVTLLRILNVSSGCTSALYNSRAGVSIFSQLSAIHNFSLSTRDFHRIKGRV